MKKLSIILISIIVVLFILSFVKDAIIKVSVEKGVEVVTGLPLRMQSFKAGIINQFVGIKNLRLFNPKGYKDKIMLDMPEIYVDYNLPAVFKGKVHVEDMRIDLSEFTVVKNEKGELNIDSLKVVEAQKEGRKPIEKAKGKTPQIQIDNLELKIGKVVYKDYSGGGAPFVREFNVNLNERYRNINNPYALVSLIVVKSLMNTTIANLTGFDLQGLEGTISGTLASAQKIAAEAAVKAEELVKQATKQAQEAAKKAEETLKKTTESLKEAIRLPLGGSKE